MTNSIQGLGVSFFPHELLWLDFWQIHQEATRQENIHPFNKGESVMAQSIFSLFEEIVVPSILDSDWVFEGAKKFSHFYAMPYFYSLRVLGEQTVNAQNRLLHLKEKIIDLLARYAAQGKATREISFMTKGSDFTKFVFMEKLSLFEKEEVERLFKEAVDHEQLQLTITLNNIGSIYEMGLSRVFYVIRRALVEKSNLERTADEERLLGPSAYLNWYADQFDSAHYIYALFASSENRRFFRVARNVRSHHLGLDRDVDKDLVLLHDKRETVEVHIDAFAQKHRILDYLCTYGTRAILSAYCRRDAGESANKIYGEYEKLFPKGFPSSEGRGFKSY